MIVLNKQYGHAILQVTYIVSVISWLLVGTGQ